MKNRKWKYLVFVMPIFVLIVILRIYLNSNKVSMFFVIFSILSNIMLSLILFTFPKNPFKNYDKDPIGVMRGIINLAGAVFLQIVCVLIYLIEMKRGIEL